MQWIKQLKVEHFLVFGLAYIFILFGLQKIFATYLWEGWMPLWLEGFLGLSKSVWTQAVGVFETVLGFSVVQPRLRKYAALIMVAHLAAVLSVTRFSDIGIRDTGILFMALSLFWLRK